MPDSLVPPDFPLVGRAAELDRLTGLLDAADQGTGAVFFLRGEGGIGKSRLVAAVAERAREKGFRVASGRAFPVDVTVPYGSLFDALWPELRTLEPSALKVLTRGSEDELWQIFPALPRPDTAAADGGGMAPGELKTRLLWTFSQFLIRFSEQQPLLLTLDDLQWADASSLELLHFLARHVASAPIVLLCVYNDGTPADTGSLSNIERSLVSMGTAAVHRLAPLSAADTAEMVQQSFRSAGTVVQDFSLILFGRAQGNAFFTVEILKSLVEKGVLEQRGGIWLGWEVTDLDVPHSVRDALTQRFDRLGKPAQRVAEVAAVAGTRVSHGTMAGVVELDEEDLLNALDELREGGILTESQDGGDVVYDFAHPVLREVAHSRIGMVRAQKLHGLVGETLEATYGPSAERHAEELAFHFSRAGGGSLVPRAVKYLTVAGRSALERYANQEARTYLEAALRQMEVTEGAGRADARGAGSGTGSGADGGADRVPVLEHEDAVQLLTDLARAVQRLGDHDEALRLWQRLRDEAKAAGEARAEAMALQRMGLVHFWNSRGDEALRYYREGLDVAREQGLEHLVVRLKMAEGVCLQEMAQSGEAGEVLNQALTMATVLGDRALLARIHRALAMHHIWIGPPAVAREHAQAAVSLADQEGAPDLRWSVHWSLAVLEGLTGHGSACEEQLKICEELADSLGSPLKKVWTSEIAVELYWSKGDWDTAIATGERAIATARALGQQALLPRLLVWTGNIYVSRGEMERGRDYLDEAWEISGAGAGENDSGGGSGDGSVDPMDVHLVVPAHTGRAWYLMATEQYAEALEVGLAGLALADRAGYAVWGIHRLLPVLAETHVRLRDAEATRRFSERLRADSERMGHSLGLAWADAGDAFAAWLKGDTSKAVDLLRGAAEALEAIPLVPDAARVRRQLAGRLADLGDTEGALQELRTVHEIFVRLGAEPELDKARAQFREIGHRPPVRARGPGAAGLTSREIEIARLVGERMSNKRIAKKLGISPRTVSTHLSNVFKKLGVGSRSELGDLVRDGNWLQKVRSASA